MEYSLLNRLKKRRKEMELLRRGIMKEEKMRNELIIGMFSFLLPIHSFLHDYYSTTLMRMNRIEKRRKIHTISPKIHGKTLIVSILWRNDLQRNIRRNMYDQSSETAQKKKRQKVVVCGRLEWERGEGWWMVWGVPSSIVYHVWYDKDPFREELQGKLRLFA